MIHQISSSLPTFKTVKLNKGLNVVVAEKSQDATSLQTRNGSGKSSLIRIINFGFGSKCDKESIFRRDSLEEQEFSISFDLLGERTTVTRSGSKRSKLLVDGVYQGWGIQPKLIKDTGDQSVSNNDWWKILGGAMFGLAVDTPTYSPTFRSMFGYFVRRESSGGFQDAQKQASQQQNWDVQINLSYLLGLDWQVPFDLQQVRLKEKSVATLKKEAKGGVLGQLVGNIGELRTKLAIAEKESQRLEAELASYQVLPEYHELEREGSKHAIRISELANENTLDRERVSAIEEQLRDEPTATPEDIEKMYKEAGVVLPDLVTKRIEDVREFHLAILKNRRTHLQNEIDDAKARIENRESEKSKLDVRRLEILKTLDAHGALDQFSKLQEELTRQQAHVEELRKKSELAKQLDSQETELTIERAQVKKRLVADLEECSESLNEAIVTFENFSKRISDHEGSLVVEPGDNGPEFGIKVEGKESKGIRNMQIFCFDMTLAVLWAKKEQGPGFLIHDSHIFDGMDSRQVGTAIEIGAEQAGLHGFQYIVTINSDQLDSAEFSEEFKVSKFRNSVEINDKSETGGIFGMRI